MISNVLAHNKIKFVQSLSSGIIIFLLCILIYILSRILLGSSNILNLLVLLLFFFLFFISLKNNLLIILSLVIISQLFLDIERINEIYLWNSSSFSVYNIIFAILIAILCFQNVIGKKKYFYVKYVSFLFPLIILTLSYFINLLYRMSLIEILYFIKTTVLIFCLYLGAYRFVNTYDKAKKVLWTFILVYALHALYAGLQSMVFDLHIFSPDILFVKLIDKIGGVEQPYYLASKTGFFFRGNVLGKNIVMVLLMLIAFRNQLFENRKIILKGLYLLFIIAIFLSLSREAVVGLVGSLLFLFILIKGRKKSLLISVVIVGFLLFSISKNQVLYQRLLHYQSLTSVLGILRDPSMQTRILNWDYAYQKRIENKTQHEVSDYDFAADNGYIAALYYGGIPGFFFHLIFWVLAFKKSFMGLRKYLNVNKELYSFFLFMTIYIIALAIFNLLSNTLAGISSITSLVIFMAMCDRLSFNNIVKNKLLLKY